MTTKRELAASLVNQLFMLVRTAGAFDLANAAFEKPLQNVSVTLESLRAGSMLELLIEDRGIAVAGFLQADANAEWLAAFFRDGRVRRVLVEETVAADDVRGLVKALLATRTGFSLDREIHSVGVRGVRVESILPC